MMSGDTSVLRLRLPSDQLRNVFQDPNLVGDVTEFCAPPPPVDDGAAKVTLAALATPLATSRRVVRSTPVSSSRSPAAISTNRSSLIFGKTLRSFGRFARSEAST